MVEMVMVVVVIMIVTNMVVQSTCCHPCTSQATNMAAMEPVNSVAL